MLGMGLFNPARHSGLPAALPAEASGTVDSVQLELPCGLWTRTELIGGIPERIRYTRFHGCLVTVEMYRPAMKAAVRRLLFTVLVATVVGRADESNARPCPAQNRNKPHSQWPTYGRFQQRELFVQDSHTCAVVILS
jgi:hypothetical protein